jgi:hypothetical protein
MGLREVRADLAQQRRELHGIPDAADAMDGDALQLHARETGRKRPGWQPCGTG